MRADLLLTNARIIDPETELDEIGDVGVSDGTIVSVQTRAGRDPEADAGARATEPAPAPVEASTVVDASGLVLCPGFIDLHSHAQSTTGLRLQSLDGVTTALDLEAGAFSVAQANRRAADEGRPINFGFSTGWALARMHLADELPTDGVTILDWAARTGLTQWQRPLPAYDRARLMDLIAQDVADGSPGIGAMVGLAPETGVDEYFQLARLAAELDVPVFTHTRYISGTGANGSLTAASEVVAAAAGSGAHLHLCHINSSSNRLIDAVTTMIERARSHGLRITTEAYPYGSAATVASAAFLDPGKLTDIGISADDIFHIATRVRPESDAQWEEMRRHDPGSLVIWDWHDEQDPADRAILAQSLAFEETAIASDATWLTDAAGFPVGDSWPPAHDHYTHPRSVGCFGKTLRWVVRDLGILSLPEAIGRCTLVPARILETHAPAVRRKGRIQVGADADITVFDPTIVTDRSTYTDTTAASNGFVHVLVGDSFVVRDGEPVLESFPGRPLAGRTH